MNVKKIIIKNMNKKQINEKLVIIGILIISLSVIYIFLIKPIQERRIYADCLSALKEVGKINNDTSSLEIERKIDICIKSGGTEMIILDNQKKIECVNIARETYKERNVELEKEINQSFKERDIIGKQVEKELEYYREHGGVKTGAKVDSSRASWNEVSGNIRRLEEEFIKEKVRLSASIDSCNKKY